MSFQEFISILNGEYKETAGTDAKNQCVDLANAYIKYVLGLPIIEWTNAVDFPQKADPVHFEWIANTLEGVPQEGDLVIWGGQYGHIAIFIEGDANRFISFDENYPLGSPCHVQEHTYLSPKVLGWLHPKIKPLDNQALIDQLRNDRDRNWNYFSGICEILGTSTNFDIAKAELEKLIGIEDKLYAKDKQLEEANNKISDLEQKTKALEEQHIGLIDDNKKLQDQTKEQQETLLIQGNEIKTLQNELQIIKSAISKPLSGWGLISEGIKKLLWIK